MNNRDKIIEYLKDGDWHCFANPGFFMKDDRTRISELRKMGYTFDERLCDGRCNVSHNSKLLMRRLVSMPQGYQKPETPIREEIQPKPIIPTSNGSYAYYKPEPTACCPIWKASKFAHSIKCSNQT